MSYQKSTGYLGEKIALNYLLSSKHQLINKNYTVQGGEIDLITKKQKFIYFWEVKTTTISESNYYNPINHNKIQILIKTCYKYLQNYQMKYKIPAWKINLIIVFLNRNKNQAKIKIIPLLNE